MSESGARSRIKTVIETVSNVGVVHDYMRWAVEWPTLVALLKTTVSGVSKLRGWMITCEGMPATANEFGPIPTARRDYRYRVRGYYALDDSAATEKTFMAQVIAVCDALDNDTTLHNATNYYDCSLANAETVGHITLGEVLCHYCEITITVTELI